MRPAEDIVVARRRRLKFYVSQKSNKGAPWERLLSTEQLDTALGTAQAEHAYEVAVFVDTPSGGIMYWTSKHPDVFNSPVLEFDQR